MPKYVEVLDPAGGKYKLLSSFNDIIEKVFPPLWLGANRFYFLMEMVGLPEDEARMKAFAELEDWVRKPCPEFLMALYDSSNKKEQEKLLRGKTVTTENIICWILQGGRTEGLFSQYSYDGGVPADLKGRAPILIDATDAEHIKTIGNTDLSDGALMHVVENQVKVIAQLMDFPDGRWYCFYRTHRGLAGRESGNQGRHLHFISSAYGMNRDAMIEGFKKGICPSNGFHVRLSGYGNVI